MVVCAERFRRQLVELLLAGPTPVRHPRPDSNLWYTALMQAKILSWNIWISSHFELVKDLLKNSGADIIGLQEVREDDPGRETVKYLNSLGYKHIFAPTVKAWGGNDGPAIFAKYEIISSKKYVLSDDNSRVAVQADIKLGDKILHVFSTHLSHTHQKETDAQMHQVTNLLMYIPTELSILMGDFNATPESQTIKKVKERLIDTDPKDQPTWSAYPEGCPICKPQKIDIRLDYIFKTKDIKTHSYKVEASKGSDHLPISVVVEL